MATWDITREPKTCSWCNRTLTSSPVPERDAGQPGFLIPSGLTQKIVCTDTYCCLPPAHTYIPTNMLLRSVTRRHTVHANTMHTHRHRKQFLQTPRLKASAILDMGVYYMAGMQGTWLVASFLFKADPSTSVWMLSSRSSSPAPLPLLLQCL